MACEPQRNRWLTKRGAPARWLAPSILALLSAACDGVVTNPDGTSTRGGTTPGTGGDTPAQGPDEVLASAECQTPKPGAAPLRRLSNFEYANTLKDLFSDVAGLASTIDTVVATFPVETESLGFRNNADFLTVGTLVAQKYLDGAEIIAEQAAQAEGLVTCDPDAIGELECAREFIRDFGGRAYRRPLTDDEVAAYEARFTEGSAGYGFAAGIEWVVFAMLQAPGVLYRVELGAAQSGEVTEPTPHEMASRLSYLIWQSTPDSALMEAAANGELGTVEELEAQARRMLADPKAERLLEYFEQWLDVDMLPGIQRDPDVYPDLPGDLDIALRGETQRYVQDLLARPDGSFGELFTGQYSFLNQALAEHYGVSGPSGSEFVKVDMPGRAGVLTQGMMLVHDKPTRTSIVRRGLKVRIDLLCQIVPAPPPDVELDLEGLGDGLTQRERLELHRSEPSCAGCHELMDPIGVVFESFDAVGRFRTVDELGEPVVTSSTVTGTLDANGDVANATELGQLLAESEEARACYVLQNFRFFYGRDASSADKCSMAQLQKSFESKNRSLSELIVALTQTDAFRYRPVVVPEAP